MILKSTLTARKKTGNKSFGQLTRITLLPDDCQLHFLWNWISLVVQIIKVMDKIKMKGDWNVLKGKLKQQFGNLTHDDLLYIEGKEEELIGRLMQKIGKTREQIRELLAKL